jgi:predicted GTPase
MILNAEQLSAERCVLNGHNLLLTGAAGTGKSFTIRALKAELESFGNRVALTATTGIACCLYSDAMTINKWSGIGDGRHGISDIAKVVQHNVQFLQYENGSLVLTYLSSINVR